MKKSALYPNRKIFRWNVELDERKKNFDIRYGHFKDRHVQHMQRNLSILSEPESSVIRQLKISRDLIEVQSESGSSRLFV